MEDPYLRHLFDGDTALNVYSKNVVNLSVGAPGPDLLKHCSSLLAKATKHRLVIIIYSNKSVMRELGLRRKKKEKDGKRDATNERFDRQN
jgi:hypothetical protein